VHNYNCISKYSYSEATVFGSQPIFVNKPGSNSDGSSGSGSNSDANAGGSEGGSRSDGSAPQTPGGNSEKGGPPETTTFMQNFKKVLWTGSHTIWMPPDAIMRLREKIMSKQPLEVEVSVILFECLFWFCKT
jgi:hypothetical protein